MVDKQDNNNKSANWNANQQPPSGRHEQQQHISQQYRAVADTNAFFAPPNEVINSTRKNPYSTEKVPGLAPLTGEPCEDWRLRVHKDDKYSYPTLDNNWLERRNQAEYERKLGNGVVKPDKHGITMYTTQFVRPKSSGKRESCKPPNQLHTIGFDATFDMEQKPTSTPIKTETQYSRLGQLWRKKCNGGVERWPKLPPIKHMKFLHLFDKNKHQTKSFYDPAKGPYATIYNIAYQPYKMKPNRL